MSLLPKSELRLRLSSRRAAAALWRTGWRARCVVRTEVDAGEQPVRDVLQALDDQGHAFARRARLVLDDDLLYFALLPALDGWRTADGAARAHFSAMLGDTELVVACTLLPCGRRWLAAAAPAAVLQAAQDALRARGIELCEVSAGLLEDLQQHQRELPRDGIVALLRDEGAMFVGQRAGNVVALAWERCDVHDAAALSARVGAFGQRFAAQQAPWVGAGDLLLHLVPGCCATAATGLAQLRPAQVLGLAGPAAAR